MFKVNASNTAAVAQDHFWIDANVQQPPMGVKLLVINKQLGVACLGIWRPDDNWTHWQALPKFLD